MKIGTLIFGLGAFLLLSASTSYAGSSVIVNWDEQHVFVNCPIERRTDPPILKITRISISNGQPIFEKIVTEDGYMVSINPVDQFQFDLDEEGVNATLGHLPGYFRITCHRPNHPELDSTFIGGIS